MSTEDSGGEGSQDVLPVPLPEHSSSTRITLQLISIRRMIEMGIPYTIQTIRNHQSASDVNLIIETLLDIMSTLQNIELLIHEPIRDHFRQRILNRPSRSERSLNTETLQDIMSTDSTLQDTHTYGILILQLIIDYSQQTGMDYALGTHENSRVDVRDLISTLQYFLNTLLTAICLIAQAYQCPLLGAAIYQLEESMHQLTIDAVRLLEQSHHINSDNQGDSRIDILLNTNQVSGLLITHPEDSDLEEDVNLTVTTENDCQQRRQVLITQPTDPDLEDDDINIAVNTEPYNFIAHPEELEADDDTSDEQAEQETDFPYEEAEMESG